MASDGLLRDLTSLQQVNKQLADDNEQLRATNRKLTAERDTLKKKLMTYNPRRFTQAMKRKNSSVDQWKIKYRNLKNKAESALILEKKLKETQESLRRLERSKIKQQKRQQHKSSHVKQQLSKKLCEEKCKMGMQLKETQEELVAMENEHNISKEELEECQKEGNIETKQDGKTYTSSIREASYLLQAAGVAQQNVSSTLKKVVKAVTSKELVGDVPSYGTQNRFVSEMKALSRQQVKEAIGNSRDNTLMYDGTTKKVGHLVEVEIATGTDTLLLGMTQQVGGSAVEYANTIVEAIKQVESTESPRVQDSNILASTSNTMTDRCIVNAAVDRKLEEIKGNRLNQFKCGMHPLDGMGKECEKTILQYEQKVDIGSKKGKGAYPFQHRGESVVQSLVRAAAEIFYDTHYSCGG